MPILYHLTSPPPPIPGTDAVFQDIEALRREFGGACLQMYPLRRPSRFFPKQLYGLGRGRALRQMEDAADAHHLFYATLYPFPWLRALKKPLIYTAAAGIGPSPVAGGWRPSIHTVVSCNPRDAAVLRAVPGLRARIIRPGIDTLKFRPEALPLRGELILAVGSAPWTAAQFRTKGIDLLLDAARTLPLRLVFLWRGLLAETLERRVSGRGLGHRVEIINRAADVNRVLAGVHAAAVLAAGDRLVKAYPHSLLESLAAGKPVVLSDCIPMADYVRETGCGTCVEALTAGALRAALLRLMDRYGECQAAAEARGRADFALGPMLQAYGEIYREVAGARTGAP